jgi:hypothetical protein
MSDDRYADPDAVKARYGKLQQDTVCRCARCVLAGVQEGPVLVPHRVRQSDGKWWSVGRWLHGEELAQNLAAAKQMREAVKRITGKTPEEIKP